MIQPAEFAVTRGKKRVVLYQPTPKQVVFHNSTARNVLYGGAAGGGKSHALKWDAYIRCLSKANYRALLLRRTYPELESTHLDTVPVDIANGLPGTYLKSDRKVSFDNGSLLRFGHCEDDASLSKYLSTEYHAIYFDELVTFTEKQYLLVRSRARAPKASGIKPVIRAGTNPGGPESHWVRRRFIWQDITLKEDKRYRPEDYAYVPATLDDNPHLDQEEYAGNLESLPEELARAYRYGDWDIFPGQYFGEWRKAKHVSDTHIAYDPELPRVLLMDYGYVKPGYIGWMVQLPEGHAYLEDEYTPVRVGPFEQGVEVARRCKERGLRRLRYLVYDWQMETPQAEKNGEAIRETFQRGMRKGGVSVQMVKGNKDRINGWPRFRAWLKDAPDERPWLRMSPDCRYAARTIPALISDTHKPEDVDSDGEDHAADALRYWAMSRPSPAGETVKRDPPKEGTFGYLKQLGAETVTGLLTRRSA